MLRRTRGPFAVEAGDGVEAAATAHTAAGTLHSARKGDLALVGPSGRRWLLTQTRVDEADAMGRQLGAALGVPVDVRR